MKSLSICLILPALLAPLAPLHAQPFPASLELNELAAGEGFSALGSGLGDLTGFSVTGVGDINHDGFDDVAISAISATPNGTNSGIVYVYFGYTAFNLEAVQLDELDGTNGFSVEGLSSGDLLGTSIAGTGDVNGDGIDDLLLGAQGGDSNGVATGQAYLIFGRTQFPARFDLNLLDGINGVRIDGVDALDNAGKAVSGAGDFNGDGINDILIGADFADPSGEASGEAYIGFGRLIWTPTVELEILNGETGFTLRGTVVFGLAGTSVGTAGDVNGDGRDDILIGASATNANGLASGETYVVFGTDIVPPNVNLDTLDGTNGTVVRGEASGDRTGFSVTGIGDVNQDGFDDLMVGGYGSDTSGTGAGSAYVVFGRAQWDQVTELSTLNGSDGFEMLGIAEDDSAGWSVAAANDFNGDGRLDLLVGAPFADTNGGDSGQAYVVFGAESFPASFNLALLDGNNGVALNGARTADETGRNVGAGGDFNGDGLDDVIIGSPQDITDPGLAHVVFGRFPTGITLGATGPGCPGLIELRSKGLSADGLVDIYRGSGRGSSVIASGACTGVELDLADATILATQPVNELGQWFLTVNLSNAALCGTNLQVIDQTSCAVSNVTQLPE